MSNYVEERMAHGSLCRVCPLNGQRKAGHDGPYDSEHLVIYDAPTDDDVEEGLVKGFRYGRILSGKMGYFVKINYFAKVGLVSLLPGRTPQYPRLGRLKLHAMPVIMCSPPKGIGTFANRLNSKIAKHAHQCCVNSAIWFVNKWMQEHPNNMLNPAGAWAMSLLKGVKSPIDPYRGRAMTQPKLIAHVPEEDIYKYVLRGVKPKEEWWPTFETWIKSFLRLYKKASRHLTTTTAKKQTASLLADNPWLVEWTKLWKKQLAALKKSQRIVIAATSLSPSDGDSTFTLTPTVLTVSE